MAAIVAKVALVTMVLVSAGSSLQVRLSASGHAPKIQTHWPYTVRATLAGKPAAAKVTAQIVDPLGGKHPVGFGKKKGNVTKVPFKGTFTDFVVWPASSTGVPLTFRLTITSGTATKILNYRVTPRA
jgi:hypothetical protein